MIASPSCTHCAKARRKCNKQRPHCLRCQERGQTCRYPLTKPSSFVAIPDDANISSRNCTLSTALALPSPINIHIPLLTDAFQWFAAPSTWAIDAPPKELQLSARFSISDFECLLATVLRWLVQWVETGSNPFIHRQLYVACMPSAIQDAYMCLTAYLHKNDMNDKFVKRIIVEKSEGLVKEGMIVKDAGMSTRDVLDNLAKVQALLVYQTLGFYDTDIRLRALADRNVPILQYWTETLMQQTSSSILTYAPPCPSPLTDTSENLLWYSWIFSESVRRIWLVVGGIQGLYKLFTNPDPSKPCMGGTAFTSRRGFWEASSASVWEKSCAERYAGLVRLTETEKMFAMVPKEEISEFAKVVLQCTYGRGWCEERWGE